MPRRSSVTPEGRPWTADDNEELVRLITERLALPLIAERLHRTPAAVITRAHLAHGTDMREHQQGELCVKLLLDILTKNPAYEWSRNLPQPRAHERRQPLRRKWSDAEDRALRHAWETASVDADAIAEALNISTEQVAARVVELNLAPSPTVALIRLRAKTPTRIPATIEFLRDHGLDPGGIHLPRAPHSSPWSEPDYQTLVDALRRGIGYEGAALALARPIKAVRSQAKAIIWAQRGEGSADDYLHVEQLLRDDPTYEWRGNVRAYHHETGATYWTSAAIEAVAAAWDAGEPTLTDLAAEHCLLEEAIARHLIAEGKASTLDEVADRIGYDPDGAFAKLLRWVRARTLHVVTVFTAGEVTRSVVFYDRGDAAAHLARERENLGDGEHATLTTSVVNTER